MANTIKVYDSAFSGLTHEDELIIVSLVAVTADKLQVIFPNDALQKNGFDYRFCAVANTTALAYGKDQKHKYISQK